MPQQPLVFEGPTPESVILDACSEFGPDVQLSAPEEFRQGGMLGFFAKRAYRIHVQPPNGAPVSANPGSTTKQASRAPMATKVTTGPGGPRPERSGASQSDPADTVIERLLAESPDFDVDVNSAARAAKPAPASFDDALARAAGALGRDRKDPDATNDTFDALVARLSQLDLDEPGAEGARASAAPSTSSPSPLAATPPSTATIARPETPRAPEPATPSVRPAPPIAFAGVPLATPPRPPARPRVEDATAADNARVVATLSSIAFPTQLLAAAAGRLPSGFSLQDVFGTLPQPRPLPKVHGSLVAVVGSERTALRHALRIANELGIAIDEVALARATAEARRSRRAKTTEADSESRPVASALAPDLYVERPEDAADLSPGWRRDRVGVVAVAIDASSGVAEGRAMLAALRPSMTLLVTDASSKSADIAFLAQSLGGVDSLLLDNLEATMTPAEVLSISLPVLTLDGERAEPALWVRHVEAALARQVAGKGR